MGLIKTLGRYAWRKFALDGVSSSGFHEPEHRDIFAFVDKVDELTAALAAAGSLKGEWDASSGTFPGGGVTAKGDTWLVTEAGTTGGRFFAEGDRIVALVVNASTSVFGANWGVIPANARTVVAGVDEGAGTANAIQVTTEDAVADGTVVLFSLFRATTGPTVTVSVNGGPLLTLMTPRDTDASALAAGQEVWFRVRASDSTARMVNDNDIATLIAQAEAVLADFQTQYLGQFAANPVTDINGNAVIDGAFYWNTVSKVFRYWDGDSWETFPNATVADGAVTNAKLADVPTATIKGRDTAGTGPVQDLTVDQAVDLLGLAYIKDYGSHTIDLRKFRTTYVDPSNWSSVLQAAADSGERTIKIPSDTIIDFEDQFVISEAGQKWAGDGYDWASYLRRTTNVAEPAILVTGERCGFNGIGLKGVDYQALNDPLNVGIKVARPSGSRVDLDFEFRNGYISEFYYNVHSFGRGCTVLDSLLTRARYPVNFDWPAAGTYSKDNFVGDSDTNGFRRLRVSGCEFHSIGVAGVRNRGWNAANAKIIIENNYSNFGRAIFAGYLGDGSVIRGNTIQNATQGTYELDGGTNWIMQNNTVVADLTVGGFSKPVNFIAMKGNHTNFVIEGFVGKYCTGHGIDMRDGDFVGIVRNADLQEVGSSLASPNGVMIIGDTSATEVFVADTTLRNTVAAQSVARAHIAGTTLKHRGLVALGAATPATSGSGTITAV